MSDPPFTVDDVPDDLWVNPRGGPSDAQRVLAEQVMEAFREGDLGLQEDLWEEAREEGAIIRSVTVDGEEETTGLYELVVVSLRTLVDVEEQLQEDD